MVDRRPRAIILCASADEVAEAIRYGRERDLEIGVRCGGHSAFGHRGATFEFVAAARWSDPAEDEQQMSAARRYAASLSRSPPVSTSTR